MKTKIFEQIQAVESKNQLSAIDFLVNNSLPLENKLSQLRDSLDTVKLTPNGENELIERLFIGLSNEKVYFPRKGDNSERFDALISFPSHKAVAEIEIPSSAILNAPRNLLDDYAVLKNRKEEKKIIPITICWDLPNKRTDYWNVISDVNKILDIKIKTISILALALHYWLEIPLDFTNDNYYLSYENSDMKYTEKLLQDNNINSVEFAGYFSPYK